MLKSDVIESVIAEMLTKQGRDSGATNMLEIRRRVAGSLAAKERHRQRVTAPKYRWNRPALRRQQFAHLRVVDGLDSHCK